MESSVKTGSWPYLLSPIPAIFIYLAYNFVVAPPAEAAARFSSSFVILYLAVAVVEIFVHAVCHQNSWKNWKSYVLTGGIVGWFAIATLFYYVSKIDTTDDGLTLPTTELFRSLLIITIGSIAFGVIPSLSFWAIERPDRPAKPKE